MAFTNLTKSSNTFSNSSKNSTSKTNESKNSTSFTDLSKNSTTFSGLDFLLKEDAFYLLLENGFKIILNQAVGVKNTNTFTNVSKV